MKETHEQDWAIYERVMNPTRVHHVSTGNQSPGSLFVSPPPPHPHSRSRQIPSPVPRRRNPSPPPSSGSVEFRRLVRDYIDTIRKKEKEEASAAAARPQPPPPSESPSDLLRSQVQISPPPSSFSSPSHSPPPVAKSDFRFRDKAPPPPLRFPSTTRTHAATSEHLPPILIPPPPGPVFQLPPPENPTPPPSPRFSSTTHTHAALFPTPVQIQTPTANPTPTQIRSPPRPRSFPSLLPCRETLTLPPKSPPSLFPPPPISSTQISEITQTQSQKKKNSEEEEKKKRTSRLNQQPQFQTQAYSQIQQQAQNEAVDSFQPSYTEKKISEEEIKQMAAQRKEAGRESLTYSLVTKQEKDIDIESISGKKNQTWLFEQKSEYELICYVDSPPTSDVSTIRGRIVFKKGRMIPYIMGLDRGRTRPPRARLKDRDPPLLFRLC